MCVLIDGYLVITRLKAGIEKRSLARHVEMKGC